MSKKYLPADVPTIITNDLFLAAFLRTVGCTLDHVERNERKRVSFVFTGDRVHELREAYRTGPVKLDMRSFRESLYLIRQMMDQILSSAFVPNEGLRRDKEQRSVSHAHHPRLAAQPQA